MIGRENIRNSAILKPQFTRCGYFSKRGSHAYAKTQKGYEQCIDCGKVKQIRSNRPWRTRTAH